MNTPSSSINAQADFFKEEILPQKFQIRRNPHGVRLINGSDKFTDKDGKEREINPAAVYRFGDKIVIETNNTIYTNTDGSDRFEDIVPQSWQESTKVRQYDAFNRKVFEKYGDIIFSRYIPRID
jgi:hypothetical protein